MRREMRDARRAIRHGEGSSPEYVLTYRILAGLLIVYMGGLSYLAASGVTPLITGSNLWAYLVLGLGLLILLRSVAPILMRPGRFHPGGIIIGLILAASGTASALDGVAGWGEYLWSGVIVLTGLLLIFAGIARFFSSPLPVRPDAPMKHR
jgi:hypothetical protein